MMKLCLAEQVTACDVSIKQQCLLDTIYFAVEVNVLLQQCIVYLKKKYVMFRSAK
jgi:hypothetical protein